MLHVGVIAIGVIDVERAAAFWGKALGYHLRTDGAGGRQCSNPGPGRAERTSRCSTATVNPNAVPGYTSTSTLQKHPSSEPKSRGWSDWVLFASLGMTTRTSLCSPIPTETASA